MRLIDADALKASLGEPPENWMDTPEEIQAVNDFYSFQDLIDAQPTVNQWIPCSERLPERIIDGAVETVQEFFVTVKERWPGEEWEYHTDIAEYPGYYIDDVWQTYNDWKEGQEVHVSAWMPLPEPDKPDDFSQHMNPPED